MVNGIKCATYIRKVEGLSDDAQTAKSDMANYRASPLIGPAGAQTTAAEADKQ